MATKFLNNLDLTKNELRNAVVGKAGTEPAAPISGQIYFDTVANKIRVHGASAWGTLEPDALTAVSVTAPLSSTGGQSPALSLPAASASQDGYQSSAQFSRVASATTNPTGDTLVLRDSAGRVAAGSLLSVSGASGTETIWVNNNQIQLLKAGGGTSGFISVTPSASGGDSIRVDGNIVSLEELQAPMAAVGAVSVGSGGITSVGGISTSGSLSISGTCSSQGAATLSSTLSVVGAATLSSTLSVTGNTSVGGTLTVTGNTNVASIFGNAATFTGDLEANNALLNGTLSVASAATFGSTASFGGAVSLNNFKITNLADPTGDQDAVNKRYVDAFIQGLDVKASVRLATTANIDLSNVNDIDGVNLVQGDRVLVKNQSTASENGIYLVGAGGGSSGGFALERAVDFNTSAKVTPGAYTFAEEGAVNQDTGFVLTTDATITLGTTGLTFVKFSSVGDVLGGAGITRTGNVLDVGAGYGILVDASSVAIDTSVVASKFAASIGDGSATSIAVTHSLNTRDVQVEVYTTAAPYDTVIVDVERTSVNAVTLNFATAPASNEYRVVVVG